MPFLSTKIWPSCGLVATITYTFVPVTGTPALVGAAVAAAVAAAVGALVAAAVGMLVGALVGAVMTGPDDVGTAVGEGVAAGAQAANTSAEIAIRPIIAVRRLPGFEYGLLLIL